MANKNEQTAEEELHHECGCFHLNLFLFLLRLASANILSMVFLSSVWSSFPWTCCQFWRSKTEVSGDVGAAAVLPVFCTDTRPPRRSLASVSALIHCRCWTCQSSQVFIYFVNVNLFGSPATRLLSKVENHISISVRNAKELKWRHIPFCNCYSYWRDHGAMRLFLRLS